MTLILTNIATARSKWLDIRSGHFKPGSIKDVPRIMGVFLWCVVDTKPRAEAGG
jgi:hypothetical protein